MNTYPKVDYKSTSLFKDVTEAEWNDWKWQFKHVIRDIPTLKKVIRLGKKEEEDLEICLKKFRMAITPYYAS